MRPYIVEKECLRFVGKCVKSENEDAVQEMIGSLFDQMNEIFANVEEPADEKFYGISANYVNGSADSIKTYWLCKEVRSLKKADGEWTKLKSGMETLVIPATRWLYIPVRYDDEFVMNLAPQEHRDDYSYLTGCVFTWGRKWLKENGYHEQDFPYELEIYGLYDGYEDIGSCANITLALPIA